jgi:hypothetical protein
MDLGIYWYILLVMFLIKVVSELNKLEIPYAIAGGYAMALHGIVRATVDVDLILNLRKGDFIRFHKAMKGLSLTSRLPLLPSQIIDFREEYIQQRNLIAWSFVNNRDPSEVVDVLLIEDLAKVKTVKINLGDMKIRVIALEELVRMKINSGRPQDLLDLDQLKKLKRIKK